MPMPTCLAHRCCRIMTGWIGLCILAVLTFGGCEAQCPTYFPYGVGTVWQVQSGSELDYSLSQGKLFSLNVNYATGKTNARRDANSD